MISEKKVIDVLSAGIAKYAKHYGQEQRKIQIMFRLNSRNEVDYITCVEFEMKNSVSLADLIGENMFNGLVRSHIRQLLKKFSKELKVDNGISLITSINEEGNVFVWLFQGHEKIRQVAQDELK